MLKILTQNGHRPWQMPRGKWKYYQEWNRALFLHWKVDLERLKRFIPDALEVDFFDGYPWVSLVAFTMEKIRPRLLPSFPPVSNFHEVNIRTYVKFDNKPGVYFLSIEGGKKLSCYLARKISGLPYRYSKMERGKAVFTSHNKLLGDELRLEFEIQNENNQKTELDLWLTERYALFQDEGRFINQFEIHHAEWPISRLELDQMHLHYPRFETLFSGTPDLMHFSPGVPVLAWDRKRHPF